MQGYDIIAILLTEVKKHGLTSYKCDSRVSVLSKTCSSPRSNCVADVDRTGCFLRCRCNRFVIRAIFCQRGKKKSYSVEYSFIKALFFVIKLILITQILGIVSVCKQTQVYKAKLFEVALGHKLKSNQLLRSCPKQWWFRTVWPQGQLHMKEPL